jgi:hypothetical protein
MRDAVTPIPSNEKQNFPDTASCVKVDRAGRSYPSKTALGLISILWYSTRPCVGRGARRVGESLTR